jgi:uncharacterized phage infection (PIP) family protein YhgE
MANVIQAIAQEVAEKLTEKKQQKIEALEKSFENKLKEEYLKTIPQDVLEAANKFPEYFNKTGCLYIHGNGWSHQYISITGSIISKRNRDYFEPNQDIADVLKKDYNNIQKLQSEISELKRDIKATLIGLKTYNRVKTEFPEAFEFLPEKITTALALNINDIRKKL